MEKLYAEDGWTYEQIGIEFNITRQRVQQILEKLGADDTITARRIRRGRKEEAIAAEAGRFDAVTGPLVRRLLTVEVAAEEIEKRLTFLGHAITELDVRSYAERHHLPVAKPIAPRFSAAMLRLAVQAAAADARGRTVDEAGAALVESEDLEALLEVSTGADEVVALAALAAAARGAPEPLVLAKSEYDAWRSRWLETYPKDGVFPWPPTAQTVTKRLGLGYWNGAVRNAGLASNASGRTPGAVIYTTDGEYELAVSEFLRTAAEDGRPLTISEYDRWARTQVAPTGAAVRNQFGGWNAAKIAAQTASGAPAARRRGPRNLPADQVVDAFVLQIERGLVAAAGRIPQDGHRAEIAMQTKQEAVQLLGDLVTAFEGFRRRWIYAAISEDPSSFRSKLSSTGDATNQEKRSWAAIGGQLSRDTVESVVSSRGLDRLLSASAGDLRSSDSWLSPPQQARLDRIERAESLRWRLLKAARNVLEHESGDAIALLKLTLSQLDSNVDPELIVTRAPVAPPTSRAGSLQMLARLPGTAVMHWRAFGSRTFMQFLFEQPVR